MRITNKLNFTNSISTSMGAQSSLYQISQQLSSGIKIQNSYEDASVYIDNTRLEYELKTLEQVKQATNSAKEMTQNSMKALQDMVKLLEDFKVKVTQAASDSNSQTSREAIAKELERIKESIVQLANTSVNGQYLFAGSQVANKPFDSNGNYYGDKNNINVVTGAGTESPYNIPGWDLFFKADGDYKKQISTNVSFTDNRWDLNKDPDKTKYLTGDSKWQQLIGQSYVKDNSLDADKDFEYDNSKLDFPPTTLYVQGTKPDGTSFKSTVLVKPEDTLEDVMENIGALYGNTPNNKVVEISMNDSGQIQITDLKQGNNKLDFHAVAYTPQFDDKTEMQKIEEEMKKLNPPMTKDQLTNRIMTEALKRNPPAAGNNPITDLQSPVQVRINNQQFEIDLHRTDFIKSKMTDTDGNATNGADYDNVYFEKNGNTVYGNVSQVIKGSNAYATDSTKLSEVMAGDSLNGTILNLKVNSKGGNSYDVTINLGNSTVSFKDPKNPNQTISFPITHTDPATGNSGVVTGSNDITYKQLNDIIGMFAADKVPTTNINPNNGKVDANGYNNLQQLMKDSQATVDVSMDYKGRISVTDKLSSGTNIEISLSDSQSGQFPAPPFTTTSTVQNGPNFSFSANNSLTIDEPNVDIIKDLDSMIDAVLKGNMRADSESENPRNTGMQGALERLDHLADHVSKLNTTMGAYHNTIEGVNTRTSFLSVNVQSIKSNVIDVDYGEAMMNLMQTQLAYQASLKASTTIAQLSLLNYM
ncbi:flagellar hook-associated protein FlgL [Campylobacter coli]|uniref:flagellar hook-associated protein FlgL n=1 Tax=Campylobacter coli TaxID=195 RepID=UPI0003D2593C|nr:flagellar hook-associated protein FlgL [Campylobacter coli]ECO3381192.1 flagellar hook-associated protein FlgL [Campylobacter coli]ETC94172.1 lagellar hook-associated protein FlgL [Campylobacter coli K3]BEJ80674.1 flagellar hook-associated protein FlgL [Campylobacter coli]GML46681.1 flagellar hook-associated protein FlgL [Campylobacter coli]HDV6527875.1 flagellar hook-associated protein FlgL [Campylobacter coli]